jgi:hypothetical protein
MCSTEDDSDLLCGLHGEDITPAVHEALAALGVQAAPASIAVVAGSVLRQPTSHSAVLRATFANGTPPCTVFLKKVTATAMAQKPWADRRRTLAYARTEARFYEEFVPELRKRGLTLPHCAHTVQLLQALGDSEVRDVSWHRTCLNGAQH